MIRAIELVNAGPFRGKHRIALEPKAYAVTARYETDPGRSNWGGKSFLFEMVDFPLHGRLKKSRRLDADGWITNGEAEGEATLHLEGGVIVSRFRRRGKATQVRFIGPDGREAAQGDAEEEIRKYLRFDKDDYLNIAYFESKQMARLIHEVPEKRLEIVRGWLGIEKAELAEERADRDVKRAVQKVLNLRTRRGTIEALLEELPVDADLKRFEKIRDGLVEKVTAAEKEARDVRTAHTDYEQALGIVEEHERVVAEGKKLASEVEKIAVNAKAARDATQKRYEEALAAQRVAEADLQTKKKVSLGLFDGRCPVAEIECPATKKINADREASADAREKAEQKAATATAKTRLERQMAEDAREKYEEGERKKDTLSRMREEIREVMSTVKDAKKKIAAGPPAEGSEAEMMLDSLRQQLTEANIVIGRTSEARARRDRYTAELKEIDAEFEALTADAALYTKSRAIFRSTQRRVSERALAGIGKSATNMLEAAAIDLSVGFSWEHEGKDYASACDDCGTAFPKSAKVKACERCGAARGMNVVRRLDVVRSAQSDGADDLCGVSLQLAAGSWLLSTRESPWATALLDEPLAAVDKSNRKALASAFVRLLGAGAFRQAFVISHSSDTADAFPGRIEIVVEKDGTRRIVS